MKFTLALLWLEEYASGWCDAGGFTSLTSWRRYQNYGIPMVFE